MNINSCEVLNRVMKRLKRELGGIMEVTTRGAVSTRAEETKGRG
jgi:hypothetical protein